MIRILAIFAVVVCATSAFADEVRVRAHETLGIEVSGATAAYLVESSLADVSISGTKIQITGRRPGMTTLSVVARGEVRTYDLIVAPTTKRVLGSGVSAAPQVAGLVDAGYNSETGRISTSVSSTTGSRQHVTRVSATSVTHLVQRSSDARTSLPAVSIDVVRGNRQLTLFDQQVGGTGLQRGSRTVRGAHYRTERVELHAGLISSLLYRNFIFSPAASGKFAAASLKLKVGDFLLVPQATWYSPGSSHNGMPGLAPGVQLRRASRDGRFRASGEIGYGRDLAAAATASFTSANHHVSVGGDHVPPTFPLAGGGPPPGSSFRGELRSRLSPRLSFSLNTEAGRRWLAAVSQRTGTSNADVRIGLGPRWSLSTGTVVSLFDDDAVQVTSVSLPIGAAWSASGAGMSGLVRYERNTSRNRGGLGARLQANGRTRHFNFRGSADYQREAATVALVFRDAPELARLFAELGFAARTPEDLARLLHQSDFPAIGEYLQRSTANLNPWRLSLRAEASWSPGARIGAARFSVSSDRAASTSAVRDHLLGTVDYTRRLGAQFDLTGSSTWWLSETPAIQATRWSYGLGIRVRFDGSNGVGSLFRRQTIRGFVYRDDKLEGPTSSRSAPMAGVRVQLDSLQSTVTGSDGQFVFDAATPGAHRVEALLPPSAGLRFTTPSVVELSGGGSVTFGIGRLPAQVIGYVRDDAGAPVPGVRLTLVCGARQTHSSTDTNGRYSMAGPEGRCSVLADPGSFPAGYDGGGTSAAEVTLALERPARAEHVVRALRSLSGLAPAPALRVTMRTGETEIVRQTDTSGRFVFRNLKPGACTLSVVLDGKTVERRVEVPAGPAALDVDFRSAR